jgi:hypothetical protein
MRDPCLAGLGLDVGEPGSARRVGDADEMLAGWALNLPAGVARVALQGLIAVGTVKLEFGCAHSLHPYHAQIARKKYATKYSYFPPMLCACRSR